jgi:hypothetical protein
LTAGGVCLYAHFAVEHIEITKEGAAAFQFGATRGIVHGSALYSILAGESSENTKWIFPTGAVLSVVEGMTRLSYVQKNKIPLGSIYGAGVIEDFGIGLGVGLDWLLREGDTFSINTKDLRLLGSTVLAGSIAGYMVGTSLANSTTYSTGDADILQTSGFLGWMTMFSIAEIAGVEKSKPLVVSSMVGAVAGLAVGHSLTSAKNYSDASGTAIRLYTSLGTIIGLGTAYAVSSNTSNKNIYFSLTTLGALTGFTLAYSSAEQESEPANSSHAWNVRFDPWGLPRKIITAQRCELLAYTPSIRFEYALR